MHIIMSLEYRRIIVDTVTNAFILFFSQNYCISQFFH